MPELPQELFKKIRKIQIHTTQLADDILAGAWHSAFKGRGMEFEEVREYQTGDEIRSIDWNVTARMNHPYIKVFREERELTVILLVDVSASSRFGSQNQLKRDLIAEIGAVLAFSAIKNNDKVGLILFSDDVEKFIPPKKGTRHVLRVIRELLVYQPKGVGTNLQKALDFVGGVLRKSSICFLISDFICSLHQREISIVSKKHDLISINVSDPYELEFPKMELINLIDLETGEHQTVDASNSDLLKEFKEKSANRLKAVDKMMKKIGAGYMSIRTDLPYVAPMRKFFKTREIKH
jgi:uncharacterized protein (DUF58 family)